MKKFIFTHKILLLAAISSIIYVIFLVPFIEVNPPPGSINPCPYEFEIKGLCNIDPHITLFTFIQSHQNIVTVHWWIFVIAYLILFILFYILFKLLFNAVDKKKISKPWIKFLSLIGFIFILLILLFFTNVLVGQE